MKRLVTALALLLATSTTPALAQTVDDGIKAMKSGNYETAKKILLPLADRDNAKAINAIGLMHKNGWGYTENLIEACNWYEKSAKAGYVSAQRNIAGCYHTGAGREQSTEKAIYWAEKAAAQGHTNCQILLAHLYSEQNNQERAAFWGQKAVDAGSTFGRVTMWTYDLPNTGLEASRMDIACVMLFNNLLSKPWNYCDRFYSSSEPNSP